MKTLILIVPLVGLFAMKATAFTLYLESQGRFYGPGNAIFSETGTSVKKFQDAEVRNLTFTGPLTGFIPMFNNGSEEPNVIAEIHRDKSTTPNKSFVLKNLLFVSKATEFPVPHIDTCVTHYILVSMLHAEQ